MMMLLEKWWRCLLCLNNDDVDCFAWKMMVLIALLENDDVDCFAWKMMMLIALLEQWWCWLLCLKMMMLIAVLKQNKNGLFIEVFLLKKKKCWQTQMIHIWQCNMLSTKVHSRSLISPSFHITLILTSNLRHCSGLVGDLFASISR